MISNSVDSHLTAGRAGWRRVFLRGAVLLLCLSAGALSVLAFGKMKSAPQIRAKSSVFDFGTISGGQDLVHGFIIENTGDRPLIIHRVERTCGCIKESSIPHAINPQQSVTLKVEMETPEYDKKITEAVRLFTNDPEKPVLELVVTGQVKPSMTITPGIINFGVLSDSELPSSQTITIRNNINDPFRPDLGNALNGSTKIVRGNKYVHTTSKQVGTKKWQLIATLPQGTPIGPVSGNIMLTPEWTKTRELIVLGQVLGDVYARPSDLYFHPPDYSGATTGSVEILTRQARISAVRIASVDSALLRVAKMAIGSQEGRYHLKMIVDFSQVPRTKPRTRPRGNVLLAVSLSSGKVLKLVVPVVIIGPKV